MNEITIRDIDNEFDNFCRENMCEKCSDTNCYNCKMSFINDRYDVEIKKKDPFDAIKKDAFKLCDEHTTFCKKHESCENCPLDSRHCYTMFVLAKERGIL